MDWKKIIAFLLLVRTASAVSIEIGPKSQADAWPVWVVTAVVLVLVLFAFRRQLTRMLR